MRAAGEVDSEIESFEDEADEPWQDDQNREEVPPLAVGREMFDHDVCPLVRRARAGRRRSSRSQPPGVVNMGRAQYESQERARDGVSRKHADRNTDKERQGKTGDDRGAGVLAEPVKDGAGDHRRDVRVTNRWPGVGEAELDRLGRRLRPRSQLFLQSGENEDIRVDGHTDREHETRNSRQGERDWNELEERQYQQGVNTKRQHGQETG